MKDIGNLTQSEIIILGTSIALEIVRCKTHDEIKVIKSLLAQILCSINNCWKH